MQVNKVIDTLCRRRPGRKSTFDGLIHLNKYSSYSKCLPLLTTTVVLTLNAHWGQKDPRQI